MPVAHTGTSGYQWWRTSAVVKSLHAQFPKLEIDQIIESIRVAGPGLDDVRHFLVQHYHCSMSTGDSSKERTQLIAGVDRKIDT